MLSLAKLMGIFAVIPMTLLLTVSFFVLVAVRKAELAGLKAFGYVIAGLLWFSAILVIGSGMYTMITGRSPHMEMMRKMQPRCTMMMGDRSQMMNMPMMQHEMPQDDAGMPKRK